jgi:Flp pilus assembly protein TadB
MADRRKIITLGFALALAVLAAVASAVWIAVLLFVLAAFLIAWGLEPRRTEAFVGRLPYGN